MTRPVLPIIMSAPMVRALLDGRKTQTRRLAWRDVGEGYTEASLWYKLEGETLLLWVRENWAASGRWAIFKPRELAKWMDDSELRAAIKYQADRDAYDLASQEWKPSIHLPRAMSRLTLAVTATKVEKLQDISEADARAEGIENPRSGHWTAGADFANWSSAYRAYRDLWDSLHGKKKGETWDDNPEVVALIFTVIKRNVDSVLAD